MFNFQYGRVNIEAQKHTIYNNSDDEELPVEHNQNEETKPPNGIKKEKNGYLPQQNGNTLISRDDNYILVPQRTRKNGQKENETKLLNEENGINDENKVCNILIRINNC